MDPNTEATVRKDVAVLNSILNSNKIDHESCHGTHFSESLVELNWLKFCHEVASLKESFQFSICGISPLNLFYDSNVSMIRHSFSKTCQISQLPSSLCYRKASTWKRSPCQTRLECNHHSFRESNWRDGSKIVSSSRHHYQH